MAGCNLTYSGHTGVINAAAKVYEQTTSGTSRTVRVVLQVWAVDYSGARDGGYSVRCSQSGTDVSVEPYQGFTISGSAQTIFDSTFRLTIAAGESSAPVNLTFSASLISPSSGTRTISGSITALYLTAESAASPSEITLSGGTVQMGKNLLITLERDSAGCTHDLSCRTESGTELEIAAGIGGSYGWTVPDLAHLCEDSLELSCRILCRTYLEGSFLGKTEAAVILTVPDPAVPALEEGSVTLGQTCRVLCPRDSENFTVDLELDFYGAVYEIGSGKLDSVSWDPGYDPAGRIPELTQGTGTLRCVTRNGTAVVGTETTTVRVLVPENEVTRPRITGLVLEPVSQLGEAFSGVYIRGKTGLRAEITAESEYSSIRERQITAGSLTARGDAPLIDLLVAEGDVKVTARVTDARGFSSQVTASITVLPYRNPRIIPYTGYSAVVCERALENGELSAKGTWLAIRAGRSYSSLVVAGAEQNFCGLYYRWRSGSGGTYTEWIPLLKAEDPGAEISVLVGGAVTSLQASYTVELKAEDALGGVHILPFQIMTEAVSFVLYDGEDGAGFGKYPEAPHVVDIASHMKLLVRGQLEVTGAQWTDLGLAEGVTEGPWGRQQETGCRCLVWGGNHVYLAFGCAFDHGGTELVLNSVPIPEAYRPSRRAYALCPVNEGMALVSADPDGYVRSEWVRQFSDTATAVTWMDGYLDYWI